MVLSMARAILDRHPDAEVAVAEKAASLVRQFWLHPQRRCYKPGSLEVRYAKEGGTVLVDFCRERGVAHEVCGKVIAATGRGKLPLPGRLREWSPENGLTEEWNKEEET